MQSSRPGQPSIALRQSLHSPRPLKRQPSKQPSKHLQRSEISCGSGFQDHPRMSAWLGCRALVPALQTTRASRKENQEGAESSRERPSLQASTSPWLAALSEISCGSELQRHPRVSAWLGCRVIILVLWHFTTCTNTRRTQRRERTKKPSWREHGTSSKGGTCRKSSNLSSDIPLVLSASTRPQRKWMAWMFPSASTESRSRAALPRPTQPQQASVNTRTPIAVRMGKASRTHG